MLKVMKKSLTFIICQMILTTFVFAQHTKSNLTNDIFNVINYTNNLKTQKSFNQCSPKVKNFALNKLNSQISKAKLSNETLEESIVRYQQKFSYIHYKQAKKTKKLLRRNRKLNKIYRKAKASNPSLSFNKMVEDLKYSRTNERMERGLAMIEQELLESGSLVSYLEQLRYDIENCTLGQKMMKDTADNMGLALLIIFIGLPVFSIIAALVTLIIGAFGWALGFFLFAVVMLAALFIWAQFPLANNYVTNPKNKYS